MEFLTVPRLSSITRCRPHRNPTSSNQKRCSVALRLPTSSTSSALTASRPSAQAAALNRVDVILEALPYIERFHGKTVVVKYGGAAMESPELCKSVMKDLVSLSRLGLRMVLVHGGGPEIDSWLARLGVEPQFINGLRVTDEMTMEAVEMVLVGKVNTSLVSLINLEDNATAVGLSGNDARLLTACPAPNAAALGFVGDPAILHTILSDGHIPVIAPVAADESGQAYNINADTVAGEIAAALGGEKLILMTDVAGIMEDRNDSSSLVKEIDINGIRKMLEDGKVVGGMIPKVKCCVKSLTQGVCTASIIDGRVLHSLLLEILTNEGSGTMIRNYKLDILLN